MLSCCKFAEGETTAIPTLSTTLFKKQFLAGEPIIVNLKLANESLEPLPRVFSSNEDFANTPDFTFIVTAADDSKICEMHRNGADIIRVVLGVVGSGEFWQCEQMFLPRINLQKKVKPESQNSIALLSPGLYKLTAKVLWNPPQKKSVFITSNNVEFQITEPTGADAESAKLMQLPEIGGFFEGILEGKPKVITALLAKYPESTYARYARARLILDEEKHIWNTNRSANTASERKELANLISDGLDYVEKNEDMPLSDNILLYCARMSRVLDRENESVQILNRLIKEFPQSDAVEAAQAHLNSWTSSPEKMRKTETKTVALWTRPSLIISAVLGILITIAFLLIYMKKRACSRGK